MKGATKGQGGKGHPDRAQSGRSGDWPPTPAAVLAAREVERQWRETCREQAKKRAAAAQLEQVWVSG